MKVEIVQDVEIIHEPSHHVPATEHGRLQLPNTALMEQSILQLSQQVQLLVGSVDEMKSALGDMRSDLEREREKREQQHQRAQNDQIELDILKRREKLLREQIVELESQLASHRHQQSHCHSCQGTSPKNKNSFAHSIVNEVENETSATDLEKSKRRSLEPVAASEEDCAVQASSSTTQNLVSVVEMFQRLTKELKLKQKAPPIVEQSACEREVDMIIDVPDAADEIAKTDENNKTKFEADLGQSDQENCSVEHASHQLLNGADQKVAVDEDMPQSPQANQNVLQAKMDQNGIEEQYDDTEDKPLALLKKYKEKPDLQLKWVVNLNQDSKLFYTVKFHGKEAMVPISILWKEIYRSATKEELIAKLLKLTFKKSALELCSLHGTAENQLLHETPSLHPAGVALIKRMVYTVANRVQNLDAKFVRKEHKGRCTPENVTRGNAKIYANKSVREWTPEEMKENVLNKIITGILKNYKAKSSK